MKAWSSNTDPKNFGKGNVKLVDWKCLCGTENRSYLVRCSMCNVEKKVVDQANEVR